ncbi:CYTH and CHAD domain-containing protein [Streptomyces sp. NPDC047525]|uniref:CYTH and CHAD domain-containing protein n=1 Tax=Streptomyces sp. NPDC047525 TaxID=3155264 RepID=UPI0033FC0257
MAETQREIERKYDVEADAALPDLTGVAGVVDVVDKGVVELDAVYHDTTDQLLLSDSITLRRRTGGDDEGWHLKLPVSLAQGVRDEIRAPLSDAVPPELAGLVRSRVRDAGLVPVMRLLTARDLRHLLDAKGALLAELSIDRVRAERLTEGGGTSEWAEIEVELADGADPALLDRIEKKLKKLGVQRSSSASKLAKAQADTALSETRQRLAEGTLKPAKARKGKADEQYIVIQLKDSAVQPDPVTAADHVLAYVRTQRDALVALDPDVRRDVPDSVHQMRVATRRMRSAFRSYRKLLDRAVTDPIGDELKWLAGELGVDRDQEVLAERLTHRVDAVPGTLLLGPVRARLQIWGVAGAGDARSRTVAALEGQRYVQLLNSVDALLADPPLRKAAAASPDKALPKAVRKDYARLEARIEHALALEPGEERDVAMHGARKAAKRARYAGEAARPALGKSAKRFAKRMKAVQKVLGDHQDSVVAREALRNLAVQAHAAGETSFTWGLLYGQEEATAAERENELPGVWHRASRPKLRAALSS